MPLEGELLSQWTNLIQEFEKLLEISVPRCYVLLDHKFVSQQLHRFCDASKRAYAAVVYLRTEYQNIYVSVCVVRFKARVAPLKELLGATILSRLLNSVKKESYFNFAMYCWTDSMTVLCWLKNSRQWKQYVWARVEEIQRKTDIANWRFCPGIENPADIPSRSCRVSELVQNGKVLYS